MEQESESPNTLHLRTHEEIEMERRNSYKQYLLDPREDFQEPYYAFMFNGVEFSPFGGLQAVSGKKKHGKTNVVTMLMAAALGSDNENLAGLQVSPRALKYKGHPLSVLYCGTEQEKLNDAKVLRRVHWLCGWDMKQPDERFNVLWLKNMPKDDGVPVYKKRFEMIKLAIEDLSPDIVFIDGIRDLVESINDEKIATTTLDYFGSLAEEKQICIWMALHQNPGESNDGDFKMRGWLGTELGNKVSDTLVCFKRKTSAGVTFTVKQADARGKDMDDWLFEMTDEAGNLGIPKIYGHTIDAKTIPEPAPWEDILKWLNKAWASCEWPMSKNKIKKEVFKDIGGISNSTRQEATLKYAIEHGFLVESGTKEKGWPLYEISDSLPF